MKENTSPAEEEQVREYSQLVRRCIRPYFLKGGDYDDLYQEGMIGLLSALRSYDSAKNDNFQAYAALCIRRRVIDVLRRENAGRRDGDGLFVGHEDVPVPGGDPEESILANETAREIKLTLSDMLSPFEASVLDRYLDGSTSSEIAEGLGRSRKSVDNAIGRIKRKLALYLAGRR